MTAATLSAPPSPQTTKRLVCFPANISSPNNFGLIRLLLSVLVVLGHSFLMLRHGSDDVLFRLTRGQLTLGAQAVYWFFTLSGFLIASSWVQTGGFGAYLKKRALRIFPGLVTAVLFCILIVGPLAGVNLANYFRDPETYRFAQILLLRDVFSIRGLPGVFHSNFFKDGVDASLWTIRYEFLCYLLLPLLALCGLLRRRSFLLILLLAALIVFHHLAAYFSVEALERGHAPGTTSLSATPCLLIFFLAGVTFYVWRDRIPRSPLLLILALGAVVLANGHDVRSARLNLMMPLAGTYIIFYAAYAKSLFPSLTRLAQRHDLSYGIYLFGFPVQQLLIHHAQVRHMGFVLTPLGLFACALPPTLGLALLSWNLVEKPCLKLKTGRRAQAVPEAASVKETPALAGVA